jgi:hypothetical protein
MLNTDPDPILIRGFDDQKLNKFTAEKKKNIFIILLAPRYLPSCQCVANTYSLHPNPDEGEKFVEKIAIYYRYS